MTALIIDTETTGLKNPEVIELAWCRITSLSPEAARHSECHRFRPEKEIEYGALSAHHILPGELEECPPSSEARLPGADYLIGHNVDFDWQVMGKPAGKRICTLALSRHLWPHLDSHSQSSVMYFLFGRTVEIRERLKNAHSAAHDILMCEDILREICRKKAITDFEALYQLSEFARIPTVMPFGKWKGTPIGKVPRDYVQWYRRQPDTDQYILEAFKRAGL